MRPAIVLVCLIMVLIAANSTGPRVPAAKAESAPAPKPAEAAMGGALLELHEPTTGERCGKYFSVVPSKNTLGGTALYFTFATFEANGRNFINLVDQAEVSQVQVRVDEAFRIPFARFLGHAGGLMQWEIVLSMDDMRNAPCLFPLTRA